MSVATDETLLVDAAIEGVDLVVKDSAGELKKFHIREIANIELVHVPAGNGQSDGVPDNIRAYVGYRTAKKRSVFAPNAVTRTFVGSFEDTREFQGVRAAFETVGAPVVEF